MSADHDHGEIENVNIIMRIPGDVAVTIHNMINFCGLHNFQDKLIFCQHPETYERFNEWIENFDSKFDEKIIEAGLTSDGDEL